MGDADTDNITFNADVNSSILPNTHNGFDLGADTKSWRSLYLGTSVIFEGTGVDAHETSLVVANPTADRTITLPNETGTLITSASAATNAFSISIAAALG